MIKNLVVSTCVASLVTTTAFAGSLVEPEMEPMVEVMEEDEGSFSDGLLLPLLALVAIGVLIAQDDDEPVSEPSDLRIKRDIVRVGTAANGLPLYNFKYLWSDQVYQGVMAQDVLSHTPDAVVHGPAGLLSVKYDMLGLEMTAVN